MAQTSDALLEVKDLRTHFKLTEGMLKAVDDVAFTIRRGRTLGLLGESGCGKSVTALSILRIVPPSARVSGTIHYHGSGGADRACCAAPEQ